MNAEIVHRLDEFERVQARFAATAGQLAYMTTKMKELVEENEGLKNQLAESHGTLSPQLAQRLAKLADRLEDWQPQEIGKSVPKPSKPRGRKR